MKYVLLITLLLGLGLTAGCSATGTPIVSLEQTTWQLEMLGTQPALKARPVTLVFQADNQVGGEAGCNGYGGTYTLNGDKLTFSYLSSTLRACAEPEFMEQEQKYMTNLTHTASYKLEGNRLTIFDAKGTSLLSFVSQ